MTRHGFEAGSELLGEVVGEVVDCGGGRGEETSECRQRKPLQVLGPFHFWALTFLNLLRR